MAQTVKKDIVTDAQRQYWALTREMKKRAARESLADFIQYMMPDKEEPLNADKSAYQIAPHHALLIRKAETVIRTIEGTLRPGEEPLKRFCNSIPPQHGKSLIMSRFAIAWALGRNPHWNIILGTYSSTLARKHGNFVRKLLETDRYQEVFDELEVTKSSSEELETDQDGSILFAGRGTGTTGFACDLFVIDDPIKGRSEAKSEAIQEVLWEWYTSVVTARTHNLTGMLMIHTRWVENDLIGLLADKSHPAALEDPEEMRRREQWEYINLPAILDDEAADILGMEPGQALWPEKHSLEKHEQTRQLDPVVFSAVQMGKPSPDDGTIFLADMIRTYGSHADRPKDDELAFYMAGDIAVSTGSRNDYSALVVAGLDQYGQLWIVDAFHGRLPSDQMVEKIIDMMIKWRPARCAFERGAIQKTIGPFLRRRMRERETHHVIAEMSTAGGKEERATSIQAMMDAGRVFFPSFMHWFPKVRDELLKFPVGAHDDFVDAIAYLGLMIAHMYAPRAANDNGPSGPKEGTLAWIRRMMKRQSDDEKSYRMGY